MSLTNAITLTEGFQTTLVAGATATGTAASQWFANQNTGVVNWSSSGTTGACTVKLQFSNDGVNWTDDSNQLSIDVNGASRGTFFCPAGSAWRVNVVTYTSGTLTLLGTVGS